MALDARTAQEHLTPDERRAMLRAFADRMLLKATAMDDPEDMPGVERAVRVAAAIERVYSRCDRAEARAPDPLKLEAARANLAAMQAWNENRHRDLGHWRKPSPSAAKPAPDRVELKPSEPVVASSTEPDNAHKCMEPIQPRSDDTLPPVRYVDYTDAILRARIELGLDPAPLPNLDSVPSRPPCFSGEGGPSVTTVGGVPDETTDEISGLSEVSGLSGKDPAHHPPHKWDGRNIR